LSGLNIQFQPSPGSVADGNKILGEGTNSEVESAVACTEVLYATLYRILGDVEKFCGTVLLVFEGFVYPLDDMVGLFYCGVPLPEAELVSGDKSVVVNQWEDSF
jgi:hypothetical protein